MAVTFSMKLQSPEFDAAGAGFELPLPVVMDTYNGDSMAAILALFDGENVVMDFRQLREHLTLVGIITQTAAVDAGFANAIQMRDEMRRIRFKAGNYGKNTGAAASWLEESGTGFWTSAALIARGEADAGSPRELGRCRLIWDDYWDPTAGVYKKLFLYGTVSGVVFGPRPGASTKERIPFSIQFLVANGPDQLKTGA